jgi:uncharacterized Zn-binding protein involved in type VI secretion
MGQPAARITDGVAHKHASGGIIEGSPDVLIGGLPAARLGDRVKHGRGEEVITEGAYTVLINGRPAARMGDGVSCGGVIIGGCGTVLIGSYADLAGTGGLTEAQAKAARLACRKAQIAAAKGKLADMPPGAERNALQAATDRFARNNVAVEYARLSQNVYHPGTDPIGWKNISNDEDALDKYGLKPSDLEIPGSNFRAQVYEPDPSVFGDDMKPAVAFKGTENMEDWKNNVEQGLNFDSPYYEKAVKIGQKLEDSGADVVFTGHSLGGGLASAASQASGLSAYTYNPAGLNSSTAARYGGAAHDSNVTVFRVAGEILGDLQEQNLGGTLAAGVLGGLLGKGLHGAVAGALAKIGLAAIMPDPIGTQFPLAGHGDPLSRHSIDQVIDGLESQKRQDQAVLAQATGINCS